MSRGADKLKITIAGEVREVELYEIGLGIPVLVDPSLPPDEARLVSATDAVRITGIGDTPSE